MGRDGDDIQSQEIEQRCIAMGGNDQQVPDAMKARGSQDPKKIRLVEMPNKREGETVETISRG